MAAATDKAGLLAVTTKEFDKLLATIATIDVATATSPHTDDGISIKDTLAHRAHWIDLFLGWYKDGKAGKVVETPAPGYKWNQLKDYNATVRAAAADRSWDDVITGFKKAHERLLTLLDGLDESELYTKHLYDWLNDWTLGRWAEASGASHYRSAHKYIRQILKTIKS